MSRRSKDDLGPQGKVNGASNGHAHAVGAANGAPRKAEPTKAPLKAKPHADKLPANYRPGESEPFMCKRQLTYFRAKLQTWRDEILEEGRETLQALFEDTAQHADMTDRATTETDRAIELRARDRQRKLIAKIDDALGRIEDGSYGYCEESGEPIGLKRLDARPIATLGLEAQERHEKRERVYRDERAE